MGVIGNSDLAANDKAGIVAIGMEACRKVYPELVEEKHRMTTSKYYRIIES